MSLAFYFALLVGVGILATRDVTCFTNRDFFDLAVANGAEIEPEDTPYDVTQDDDVIDLPGEQDDELDAAYLVERLGWTLDENGTDIHLANVGDLGSGCSCRRYSCGCCVRKTFSAKIWFKRIRFTFRGCITVTYLPRNTGFRLTITLQGRRIFQREISLRHPPRLCYGVPGLRRYAKVCLELYNINLARKSICARLVGVITLKIKTFRVRLRLGCFRIPILSEAMFAKITYDDRMLLVSTPNLSEALSADITDNDRQTFEPTDEGNSYDVEDFKVTELMQVLEKLDLASFDVESIESDVSGA